MWTTYGNKHLHLQHLQTDTAMSQPRQLAVVNLTTPCKSNHGSTLSSSIPQNTPPPTMKILSSSRFAHCIILLAPWVRTWREALGPATQ
jgi:hypothetical protein